MTLAAYEYHFYVNQYHAPDLLSYAKVIHDDVKGYKKNGFLGIIEDGTQRAFFPNGFNLYVYASTLFDVSCDFDGLVEDYFSHAYGEDWEKVRDFFMGLRNIFEPAYLMGRQYTDPKRKFYSPEQAKRMEGVYAHVNGFVPFLDSHKNMPMRAQTVAYKLLRYYTEWCVGIAKPCILKAYGADEMAAAAYRDFLSDFGKHECEIEAYCDQHMFGMAYDSRFTGKLHIMNVGGQ